MSDAIRPARPAAPATDRRVAVRRRCAQDAMLRPDVVSPDLVWEGRVHDVAPHGFGLHLPCPFPPGTMLSVDVPWVPGVGPLLARVVHTRLAANGWLHGCELTEPLSDAQVRAFL